MSKRLVFGAVLLLAACSMESGVKPGEVKHPDTFVNLTISDIDSLDPAWSYDTSSSEQILQMYDTLFGFKGASVTELEPWIAEKVPTRANGLLSKDGRTYRVPIRKGVHFHDGTELTPADVKYSLMRFCLYDRDAGPSALLLEPLTGYVSTRKDGRPDPAVYKAVEDALAIDGDSVVIKLHKPFAPFLTILAQWAPVVSRHWARQHGAWDGNEATWIQFNNPRKTESPFYDRENGSGPFKLERWDKDTRELVMVRNEDYWRAPAKLKRYVVKSVDEFATRKLMLANGDADAIYADREVYPDVASLPGVTILDDLPSIEMNPVVFFTFDVSTSANANIGSGKFDGAGIPHDFFGDVDVRKAFAYSLDYQGYLRDIARGKGKQGRGPIPSVLIGEDPTLPLYSLDPKKAEAHFRKAFGGRLWEKGFHFTIAYNEGNKPRQVIAEMFKRSVEALNPKFKIDTRGVQWSTFLDDMAAHKLPLFIMGWQADYPDAHDFAAPMVRTGVQYAPVQRFSDPEIDRLVDAARGETNQAKRRQLYFRLQKRVYDLAPQLYPIEAVRFRTQRDWVRGYEYNPVYPDAPYACYMYSIWKEAAKPAAPPARASR